MSSLRDFSIGFQTGKPQLHQSDLNNNFLLTTSLNSSWSLQNILMIHHTLLQQALTHVSKN